MANANAVMIPPESDEENLFDDLGSEYQSQEDADALRDMLDELDALKEDREKIGNPDSLGNVVEKMVWEQFQNQLGVETGTDAHTAIKKEKKDTEDFITDIRKQQKEAEANISKHKPGSQRQVAVKLAKEMEAKEIQMGGKGTGKYTKEEREQWRNPKRNELGEITSPTASSGHLGPKGKRTSLEGHHQKNVADHPELQANPDNVKFYNAEDHLKQHGGDFKNKTDGEMVDRDGRLRKQHKINSVKTTLSGGVRAAVMSLLSQFLKDIIGGLVRWFKIKGKNIESLINSIKESVFTFVKNLKKHLKDALSTSVKTIVGAIVGPIVGTVTKIWTMLKQGWRSLKEAFFYLKNPDNKNEPWDIKVMKIGKIVIAGLSGVGAIVLGEVIEKALIPIIGIPIPLLGNLASVVGLFSGGLVAGIIGAVALNWIDKLVANKQREENRSQTINKQIDVLKIQRQINVKEEVALNNTQISVARSISNRHIEAGRAIKEDLAEIDDNDKKMEDILDEMDKLSNNTRDKLNQFNNKE